MAVTEVRYGRPVLTMLGFIILQPLLNYKLDCHTYVIKPQVIFSRLPFVGFVGDMCLNVGEHIYISMYVFEVGVIF